MKSRILVAAGIVVAALLLWQSITAVQSVGRMVERHRDQTNAAVPTGN